LHPKSVGFLSENVLPHSELLVLIGRVLHDIGKIEQNDALEEPGDHQEVVGERLLRALGVSVRLPSVCRALGAWAEETATFEDKLIALANHVWKAGRYEALEALIVKEVALRLRLPYWELFIQLDEAVEKITRSGKSRLAQAFR